MNDLMLFSEERLSVLRESVKKRLSEKRFCHTLGVEIAAEYLAKRLLPERVNEIRAAALLHDITKEKEDFWHIEIMKALPEGVSDSDLMSPSVFHSLTAPYLIKKDFSDLASQDILSAVRNHTTGAPDMSLFDEIIFLSDYIEQGRRYPACVSLREELYSLIKGAKDAAESEVYLHDATVKALENTIISLIQNGKFLHEKTVSARNAFLARRPMPLR